MSHRRSVSDPRQFDRLRLLAETSHDFAEATPSLPRLLDTVARRLASVIGDGCYIRLLAADGSTLVPVATFHPDPDIQRFLRETTDGIPLRVGEGISGKVVETGEAAWVPVVDFAAYKAATKPEFVPHFERIGVSSLVVVRLRARGVTLGFVALVRNGTGRPGYTEADLHLLQDLADRAALAIDTAQLVEGLETRVRERTAELQAANRELEAFAYSVSHDLRAPLRAIDGFSRILAAEQAANLDDNGRRLLGIIRKNTQRMAQLIEDLLRFSRAGREELSREEVDMGALVGDVVREVSAAHAGRSLDIRVGALPAASGDAGLLRQVWTNLVDNAVKYSRPRAVGVVAISGLCEGDEIRYTVADNGVGFDPRYAHKLFGVFARLHDAAEFEGTGVGLALVERIVSRHGGRVWAECTGEGGSTFGFSLPRAQG